MAVKLLTNTYEFHRLTWSNLQMVLTMLQLKWIFRM